VSLIVANGQLVVPEHLGNVHGHFRTPTRSQPVVSISIGFVDENK
jgi:hypothetical protein